MALYAAFVAAVQWAWNAPTGQAVLEVLEPYTFLNITPAFALRVSVILSVRDVRRS
jgi:hypothetical protein